MRALYIDESARDNRFYFFGGLLVDDDAARSIEVGLSGIGRLLAENIPGFDAETELHGNEMFHGHGAWGSVPIPWRVKACELVSKAIARSGAEYTFRGIDLTALRARYVSPYPAHLLTLAHILDDVDGRLDRVLGGVALVLADDHHSAATSRRNLVDFKLRKVPGYTQGKLENLVDTIYFGPSHASRLLQAADVATFFFNREKTIIESDARAQAAVGRIVRRIRQVTVSEYTWEPTDRRSR
ncbi:DUF3800 domain-containing protein [Frigoribacterium faeni]|uniref:DUF3800 domain-containing protein n=1 Tax=Frigoribacterium faeni TaxID=145483 RepID=UPI0024131B5E|nr:DUF3800 domain-containing protein [Frigoribacterium faeni]